MKRSSLKDNLTSDFLESMALLRPKNAPHTILVYVESDEDIAFWRSILNQYTSSKINFNIQLPSKSALEKGKNKALERGQELLELGIGKYLIVCVDSDYDYLLQGKTPLSKLINESNYIFQTYAYSIENLRCFSESLHLVIVQATNIDAQKINFVELLKLYSQITYPLLFWSLAFRINKDFTTFPLKKMCEIIHIHGKVNIHEQGKKHLKELKNRVALKIEVLRKENPEIISQISTLTEELAHLGLTPENTYLFLQGHTVESGFVLHFLESLSKILRAEVTKKIHLTAKNTKVAREEVNHFINKLTPVQKILQNNTEFKNCFLYKKIKADLDKYMGLISA